MQEDSEVFKESHLWSNIIVVVGWWTQTQQTRTLE